MLKCTRELQGESSKREFDVWVRLRHGVWGEVRRGSGRDWGQAGEAHTDVIDDTIVDASGGVVTR